MEWEVVGQEGEVKAGFAGGRDAQEAVDSQAYVWQEESRLVRGGEVDVVVQAQGRAGLVVCVSIDVRSVVESRTRGGCGRGEAWAGDSGESRLGAGPVCQGGTRGVRPKAGLAVNSYFVQADVLKNRFGFGLSKTFCHESV